MAAVDPGGEAYVSPHHVNNQLIESVHRAIRIHPSPIGKANYGKILAQLLAQQAKDHQAAQQISGGGRVEAPPVDTGGAYLGSGAVADANGFPSNWADVARGNPHGPAFVGNPLMEVIARVLAANQAGAAQPAMAAPPVHGPVVY